MNDLVPIFNYKFGDEKISVVDARNVWMTLKVKTPYTMWIDRKIDKAQLIEGQDYISFNENVKREVGATTRKEVILSLDAAKHIGMMGEMTGDDEWEMRRN